MNTNFHRFIGAFIALTSFAWGSSYSYTVRGLRLSYPMPNDRYFYETRIAPLEGMFDRPASFSDRPASFSSLSQSLLVSHVPFKKQAFLTYRDDRLLLPTVLSNKTLRFPPDSFLIFFESIITQSLYEKYQSNPRETVLELLTIVQKIQE